MGYLKVLDHPLIDHKMAIIRNKNTGPKEFRESVFEIGMLLTYELSKNFKSVPVEVETPMEKTTCYVLEKPVVIVPILRAGLGMVEGIHTIIPQAKLVMLDFTEMKNIWTSLVFCKLPPNITEAVVLVVDPMLATGGSASVTISMLKEKE